MAGTASATPSNVISSDSESRLATLLVSTLAPTVVPITLKAPIIPLSVPSRPIIGPSVPSTANMLIFFSISAVIVSPVRSIESRASARPFGRSAMPVVNSRLKKESSSLTRA